MADFAGAGVADFVGSGADDFASGATWTVDAGTGAAPAGGLTVEGFTGGDMIDITNLTPSEVAAGFNPTSHGLNTAGDGSWHFSGAFSNEYFVFNSDGGTGTDVTVATGDGISTIFTSTVTLGSRGHPSPLTITSTGEVRPTVAGASAVVSNVAGTVLTNNGVINGASGPRGGVGGPGGTGVKFSSAGTLTNTGSITGGTGGTGSAGAGGAGGWGVSLAGGAMLLNSGTISGGAGGSGTTSGGAGGAGVFLNGGTLTTSGTISGGTGGSGSTPGKMGAAAQFGANASTLIVDPGAVFNGQVAAHASAGDVLELSGTQAGGTAVTLGTQFTNFSTLEFASGAAWTADATRADLIAHPLTLEGFALGDALDITNLPTTGTTQNFNSTTDLLTLTHGTTVIGLQFNSSVSGDHFVLTASGSGTDVTLASGPGSIFAELARDVMNFVSDDHRALIDGRMMPVHGLGSSLLSMGSAAASDPTSFGFASHALIDHGLAHGAMALCKA